MKDLSAQLQTGLQAFLQQSMEQMFTRLAPAQTQPPAATSTAPPPHTVSITPVSAIPPAKAEEPMDLAPSQPAPPEVKKGFSKVKRSSAIAQQSIQAVVSQVKVPTTTPSTQPSFLPTAASAPRLASPLQALEQEEYGTDASASSFSSASKPEDPTEVGEQAAPPNFPFRELVQKVREFLSIPDPAAEEDYKLGSALGRDPLLRQQEKLDRPTSIKLPMVADLSRLQTAQDDSVKPSTSNTLEIGKFPGSGGQTKAVPSGVGKTWVPPVDHRAHKRRIQVALQGTPKPIQGTLHNQQLRRLRQTKCLMDLYSRPAAERRSRSRSYPRKSGILQLSLPGSKTRQPLEASHRLEFTKQIPGHPKVQDGDPRVHTCLPQERGMCYIYRSHTCLLTRANSHPVSKIPQVSFQRRHLPVHQPPLQASNSPPHFHQYSQRGKTDSFAIRNQTPPIPGRIACINGEDCKIGQDAYETFSVASQNSLEISDASGHTDPLESEDDMTRGMVVRPSKCATRRTSPPQGTRKTDIYRRLKRRLGRSLRSKFYRRALVSFRKAG